jgi:hypothetical protein
MGASRRWVRGGEQLHGDLPLERKAARAETEDAFVAVHQDAGAAPFPHAQIAKALGFGPFDPDALDAHVLAFRKCRERHGGLGRRRHDGRWLDATASLDSV